MSHYEDFANTLVKGLCRNSNPKVVRTVDERGVLLTISGVEKQDMGTLIGRGGEHVNAVRMLLRAVGKTENAHVSIVIEEPVKVAEHI